MANKIYAAPETAIVFKNTGGDVTFAPHTTPLAFAHGRISNQLDRGAGSKPTRYRWRMRTRWATTATAGETLRLYLVTSDGTNPDGSALSTTDADLSSEVLLINSCQQIGAVVSSGVDQVEVTSGICMIYDRYAQFAVWNASAAKALTATASDHIFTLTPMPDEIQ